MRLEHESVEKLKKEILRVVTGYVDVSKFKVFFFGSRVAGKGDDRSDIDIGIEGKEPVPVETMMEIEDEIRELPVFYKMEIVDFKKVSDDFYKVAKQNVEFLN